MKYKKTAATIAIATIATVLGFGNADASISKKQEKRTTNTTTIKSNKIENLVSLLEQKIKAEITNNQYLKIISKNMLNDYLEDNNIPKGNDGIKRFLHEKGIAFDGKYVRQNNRIFPVYVLGRIGNESIFSSDALSFLGIRPFSINVVEIEKSFLPEDISPWYFAKGRTLYIDKNEIREYVKSLYRLDQSQEKEREISQSMPLEEIYLRKDYNMMLRQWKESNGKKDILEFLVEEQKQRVVAFQTELERAKYCGLESPDDKDYARLALMSVKPNFLVAISAMYDEKGESHNRMSTLFSNKGIDLENIGTSRREIYEIKRAAQEIIKEEFAGKIKDGYRFQSAE